MSFTRRQIIEAGAATGALALVTSTPLLAQVVRPSLRSAPPLPVPARPRVMVDPTVDPRIVARARAAFDRHRSQIVHGDIVGIADFTRASGEPRFYLLDTFTGRVTRHLVAHGRGSDPAHTGFLQHFSNRFGSEASSNGAYLTSEYYQGRYGRSMRVRGLDPSNSNAEARAIVVHTAWYAEPECRPGRAVSAAAKAASRCRTPACGKRWPDWGPATSSTPTGSPDPALRQALSTAPAPYRGAVDHLPSSAKREPWHGQSQLRSVSFQPTMQPIWVQTAERRGAAGLVAIAGDVAAVDLEDRRLARGRARRSCAACARDSRRPGGVATSALPLTNSPAPASGLIRVASNRLEPGIVAAGDQVGEQDRRGGAVGDAPGVEAGRDQIADGAPLDDQPMNGAWSIGV